MFGSVILDVAVGMIFVYLLLSLMVTALSEIIAAWLKRRNGNLWLGMTNLVGTRVARQLYAHPLIQSLSAPRRLRSDEIPRWWMWIPWTYGWIRKLLGSLPKGPSYIPSRTFAMALLDVVRGPGWSGVEEQVRTTLSLVPDSTADARTLKTELSKLLALPLQTNLELLEFQRFLDGLADGADGTVAKKAVTDFLARDPAKFQAIRPLVDARMATLTIPNVSGLRLKSALMAICDQRGNKVSILKKFYRGLAAIPDTGKPSHVRKAFEDELHREPLDYAYLRAAFIPLLDVRLGTTPVKDLKVALRQASRVALGTDRAVLAKLRTFLARIPDNVPTKQAVETITGFMEREGLPFAKVKRRLTPLLNHARALNIEVADLKASVHALAHPGGSVETLAQLLENIPDTASATTLKAEVTRFLETIPAAQLVPSGMLTTTLRILLAEAGYDPEKFKQNIEVWFNNSMDRVAGWYKRKTQLVNLVLSFGIAIGLNVDSILLFKALSENSTLRASLVTQATKFVEQNPQLPGTASPPAPEPAGPANAGNPSSTPRLVLRPDSIVGGDPAIASIVLNAPAVTNISFNLVASDPKVLVGLTNVVVPKGETSVEWQITTEPVGKPTRATLTALSGTNIPARVAMIHLTESPNARFQALQGQLESLNLPIGWVASATNRLAGKADTNGPSAAKHAVATNATASVAAPMSTMAERNLAYRLVVPWSPEVQFWPTIQFHFLGWILTAIAISLGAPVWFDLLNKVVTIRSSGKAPEENPKPPKEVPKPMEPGAQR